MRYFITLLAVSMAVSAFSQETSRPLTKRVIIKTNLLSLIAQRPTVSIEKAFSRSFSTEIAYVQGQFNHILLTDHYSYNGFLLRAKKHFIDLDYGAVSPFLAVYAGNLRRNIDSQGAVDNTGWIGYPSRYFSANSIRGGGTFGISYISKNKFVIEVLGSLGYGRYINIDKSDPDTYSNGYLDVQTWLSIGYAF